MTLKQLVKAGVGFSHYNIYVEDELILKANRSDLKYKEFVSYEVDEFTVFRNTMNIYLIKKED